jgi:hypothetical protein
LLAFALQNMRLMNDHQVLDDEVLLSVSGGAVMGPGREPREPGEGPRTWGQVGREYLGACVQGAGQSMMFGGLPRNARQGLVTAAMGCAMGVGMKAVDDLTGAISGSQAG